MTALVREVTLGSDRPAGRRPRAVTLRVVRDGSFALPPHHHDALAALRAPLDTAAAVYRCMAPYAEREATEAFGILPLNLHGRLTGAGPILISRGTMSSTLVDVREVFCAALLARAASVVLCHNHPSGDPRASSDDLRITWQLSKAGRLLDIPVNDHVIVGHGQYLSFTEQGLL